MCGGPESPHKKHNLDAEQPIGILITVAQAFDPPTILTMQDYCKFVPATLDAAKTGFLAAIAEGKSKIDGVQLAEFVADKILEWRRI
ncbi:hypothetical protein C7B69_10910 [filamentous cyanobacterium Phorm 46]|nr:hypothetical protein C7B69_10910 [filamentous cyanobacterium Phorm 46]PSB47756.1 hypothetical protein C7B67_18695 [filamentous cyanobacterium Phorm 6]